MLKAIANPAKAPPGKNTGYVVGYTEIDPIDVVSAVFHKVGPGIRVTTDERLFAIFNETAQKQPERLDSFAWHPVYHDNEALSSALRIMGAGGTLVRENASTAYFCCSPRLEGTFGSDTYKSLEAIGLADLIDEIVVKINTAYRG